MMKLLELRKASGEVLRKQLADDDTPEYRLVQLLLDLDWLLEVGDVIEIKEK